MHSLRNILLNLSVGLFAITFLEGCDDDCGNEIVSEEPSPDAQFRAILFERSCGATTGSSSQISVLEKNTELVGAGNVFSADTNHGEALAETWGGPFVEVSWRSSNLLVIVYDAKSRVFLANKAVDEIEIRFEKAER